jgi:hypothetical protein
MRIDRTREHSAFLIADDLIGELDSKPTRYVIDFHPRDQLK